MRVPDWILDVVIVLACVLVILAMWPWLLRQDWKRRRR